MYSIFKFRSVNWHDLKSCQFTDLNLNIEYIGLKQSIESWRCLRAMHAWIVNEPMTNNVSCSVNRKSYKTWNSTLPFHKVWCVENSWFQHHKYGLPVFWFCDDKQTLTEFYVIFSSSHLNRLLHHTTVLTTDMCIHGIILGTKKAIRPI